MSYTGADQRWAEWIAWRLEQAGYSIIIQAWDFPAGANFVYEMDQALKVAQRLIAVLSPAYLRSKYAFAEWAEMFRRDPQGRQRLLVPVKVQACDIEGLLGPIVHINLEGLSEKEASKRLLTRVRQDQAHPAKVDYPGFPHLLPEHPDFPGALPATWMVPFSSNRFFTGREQALKRLGEALRKEQRAALTQPAALSGLGGVGKTQLAVEYAYHSRQDYQRVFWTQADSRESLISGFVKIAHELALPQCDEQDQAIIVQAVQCWLRTHDRWLLVLDNADDLGHVKEFLPPAAPGGHILLTTRAQAMSGLASRIEVGVLDEEQGALLLLRRADLLKPEEMLAQAGAGDIAEASALSRELGGLPLALDQAGAYIEETSCSLTGYRTLYQAARKELLQRRGGVKPDHPESVAVTFRLAFEKVARNNEAAADLLRLCAFLAPDAIPEEIITQGAEHLGQNLAPLGQNPLLLNEAIAALGFYSLLRRDAVGKTFSVHRLVQAVLRDEMDEQSYRQWAERAVWGVNAAFPDVEFANWPQYEQLLPHALVCAALVEQGKMAFPEAAQLLHLAGCYLIERARHTEAEPFIVLSLTIREQVRGSEHIETSSSLDRRARIYELQGNYQQAALLYQRALAIKERVLGPDDPNTAQGLNNLALIYKTQGKFTEAEPLFLRALTIKERILGPDHPVTAQGLNNLAALYRSQGRYAEAEPLFLRALSIRGQQLGLLHPDTGSSLYNLAELYRAQGRYEQAEPLYLGALQICLQQLGAEHTRTTISLNGLAMLYYAQGKYEQAESLLQYALAIWEQQLKPDHPDISGILDNLAMLYSTQGKYQQAELLYRRALAIREQWLGPDHLDTASTLNNLALLYYTQGEYKQAESLHQQALVIREQQLGPEHPATATSLHNLAALYYARGKYEEAEPLYERALAICQSKLGEQHANTITACRNHAELLRKMGREEEAQKREARLLQVSEASSGDVNPPSGDTEAGSS